MLLDFFETLLISHGFPSLSWDIFDHRFGADQSSSYGGKRLVSNFFKVWFIFYSRRYYHGVHIEMNMRVNIKGI